MKTNNKKKVYLKVLARRRHVHISTKRTAQATRSVHTTYSKLWVLLAFEAIRCLCCRRCPHANVISYRARPKGEKKAKDWRRTKNWLAAPLKTKKKVSHLGQRRLVGRRERCAPKVSCRLGPAVDVKCRVAEAYRKGTQGSVLASRAASLLLGRLLLLY